MKYLLNQLFISQQVSSEYVSKLALIINTKFDKGIADKLLHSIKSIENLREF
jgi:hypothetical protein